MKEENYKQEERKIPPMLCEISRSNILPTKTRSGAFEKRKVRVVRAARMADLIVVRYSDGLLRVTHASKVPGATLVPVVRCKGHKDACKKIVQILEGTLRF